MHHRSLIEIAFAAMGITYEGAGPGTVKQPQREPGPVPIDDDEDWMGSLAIGPDDGQNGDGVA